MLDVVSVNKVAQPLILQLFKDPAILHPHGCSSKGKQDQRLQAAHGQVHTYKCLCMHAHTSTHMGRGGECWQRLNVFARSRGEGKKGSRRAETNACWLLLVELWSGMEGWGNVFTHFVPPQPFTPNPFPFLQPSHPIISILERRWMKGTTPQWQHFSLQTYANAFWRLLNCTWYRQGPFSFKSKTDCFSLGRGLLDKRDDKAGTVQPSGGWRMEGVSLWIVCVYGHVFFLFLFYARLCHEKIRFVLICCKQVCTCGMTPKMQPLITR